MPRNEQETLEYRCATSHLMRQTIITDEFAPGDPEAKYLCEVTARIAAVLPGLHLTPACGLALRSIVMNHSIVFRDGFVVQNLLSLTTTIGHVEASMIVAALDSDPAHSMDWWDQQRFIQQDQQAEEQCYQDLLRRIAAHSDVVSVT
jgi:hypothetical protein